MLYQRYQAQWHFSSGVLTSVFAIYALTVIGALLGLGSASDLHGRRPSVVACLTLCAVSMLMFIEARDVSWLFVARALQGLGVGIGLSSLGGMLLDVRPLGQTAALINTAAPNAGMAVGALGTGLLIDYAPLPTVLVYVVLLAVFLAAIPMVLALPETALDQTGAGLLHRIGPPKDRRKDFWLFSLGSIATWAVGGFDLSLSPTVSADFLNSQSYVVDSLSIVILGVAGLITQIVCQRWSFRRSMVVGAVLLALGMSALVYSLWPRSVFLFFAGSVVLSCGWGLTSIGSFRALVALATPTSRAELVAAVYVVSYLAFSLPSVAVGFAVSHVGLRDTMVVFGVGVAILAAVAAVAAVTRLPSATDSE